MIVNLFTRRFQIRFLTALVFSSFVALATVSAFADQNVVLSWDASPSPNVAGYNIYYGGGSLEYTNMIVVGNVTNVVISGLTQGRTYYFAATAYDISGVESDYSPEVVYWIPSTNAVATLPPTISGLVNQIIPKNSSLGPVPLTLGDPDTSADLLTLSAFSSYPLLVPVSGIVFSGSGANRTVQITPTANLSGTATIGIIVTDDTGNTSVDQFSLTVLASVGTGGSTPVVSTLTDATLAQNSPGTNLSFSIADTDTPIAKITVTVSTDNPLLFPSANLSVQGSGANRVLHIVPAVNRSGSGHVTVSAIDDLGHIGTSMSTVTVLPGSAPQSLVLLTSGSGSVSPNLSAQPLTVGKKYSVTAKPAAGQLFAGWTGDIISSSATLNFTLTQNLTLQANFIPNPYIPASGSYTALFAEEAGVRAPSAGMLTASITRSGSYSGRVKLAGGSYSISGKMNLQCQAVTHIKQGTNILIVSLQADQAGQLFGNVSENSWIAPLQGVRSGSFNSKTNPAPQAGQYTMMLHGKPNDPVLPSGHSFGSVKVSASGLVSFVGMLADGTKVSESAYLSQDGVWPFYVSLYSNTGLMQSWQTFQSQSETDFAGWLVWIKPANPSSRFYPNGFDYERNVFGEKYIPPVGTNSVFASSSLLVPFAYGDLPENFMNSVQIEPGSKIVNLSTNKLSMSFSTSTGIFTGTVADPVLNKTWSFTGAIMQRDNVGYGFLSGTNASSQMSVVPN